MKENKYSHLNKYTPNNNFNWGDNLLKRSLPPMAFQNNFTGGFLTSIQTMLVMGFKQASIIKKYFRF